MTYEELTSQFGGKVIQRTDDDGSVWFIPIDPANSDYQRYLRWLNGEEEDGTLS